MPEQLRYGYHRTTSPRLDALAKEGVLFERVYATDVLTQPSLSDRCPVQGTA